MNIFYLREDEKKARILLSGMMFDLSRAGKNEFEGEAKKLNLDTGDYEVFKVHVVVKNTGDLTYKTEFDGYQYVIRKNISFYGLRDLGQQIIEKLTNEERKRIAHITVGEIMDVLKEAYKKKPDEWTVFENACKRLQDKHIQYFTPVRRPKWKKVPTGDVRNADIDVEINNEKYHIDSGTLAESVDCDEKGAMWYRFAF